MVNVFPPHQQSQIRQLLSFTLQAVVSQQLIPKSFGVGRCLAVEVMIPTMAIRSLIREDKIHQIYSAMQSGQEETGMQTMNQSLFRLIRERTLSQEAALEYSFMPEELMKMLGGQVRA
jgi:twitching motility protein PilT